jgi:hypothetical protein
MATGTGTGPTFEYRCNILLNPLTIRVNSNTMHTADSLCPKANNFLTNQLNGATSVAYPANTLILDGSNASVQYQSTQIINGGGA